MSVAQEILKNVEFKDYPECALHLLESVEVHKKLGFLASSFEVINGGRSMVDLIGFGVPGWQGGTEKLPEQVRSITELDEIWPRRLRTMDRQGKGVGIRMYNTVEAVAGAAEQFSDIGVYRFAISPRRVYDARHFYDHTVIGKAQRVMRHAWLSALAGHVNLDAVIESVHGKQGEVDIALYNQTVAGNREKKRHGHKLSSNIPEEMLIVRNPLIQLTKIGEVHV